VIGEEDLLPLSALQHLVYCERQAALIHVERVWQEDAATALGRLVHERVDVPGREHRRGVRVARGVALCSARLGVSGRADVVEYHWDPGTAGGWRPFPVEFKRGRTKRLLADRVQLCAQAMCLEEMHGLGIPGGALFYDASHRRIDVPFDDELRCATDRAARRLHEMVKARVVPRAVPGPRCRACSLEPLCLPEATAAGRAARVYLQRLLEGVPP
jgi:CRISPR-associated exonuclease Cas4